MAPLTLIANPGSASRKYALYEGTQLRARLHFEFEDGRVICTLQTDDHQHPVEVQMQDLGAAAGQVVPVLQDNGLLRDDEHISDIGLRVVAPTGYFLQDHEINDDVIRHLESIATRAPLHILTMLDELRMLRERFSGTRITGISDSGFHSTKPEQAWNYGLPLEDADRLEIKRYGYHGLSAAAAVSALHQAEKLPRKLVLCHLGSGISITAVQAGKSIDTTMGYSPLEGVIMGTRSGSIDATAVRVIKDSFHFDDNAMEQYLNNHSGLLGLGGSSDIRELLRREADNDHRSQLALQTYVYVIQKAIGQMVAALDGLDMVAFTGTVGERSVPIRQRICERLRYLDIILDQDNNQACEGPEKLTCISRLAHSKPVYVVPADEAGEMARHLQS